LRAWWWHRQGFDGALQGRSAAAVLEQSGWARSVGGVGPYLTLFARAGLSRQTVDAAVAKLEIHELPSARGCTYVLPAQDFALGVTLSQGSTEGDMNVARKLGVTDKEIDRLCDAVLAALKNGPLDPDEIRDATGTASRNLGAEGKKKGMITTLPLALGRLQVQGEIRRIPTNGRLDQQRYKYALWRPNPLERSKLSKEEAVTELARRYFRWIGPATVTEFQAFAGCGVKAAKQAVNLLKLVPVEDGSDKLTFADDRDSFGAFTVPKTASYALVSSLDSLFLHRRDLPSMVDDADLKRKVTGEKGVVHLGGLTDLPSHAIVDRGRLVGLWEFDPDTAAIAWTSFIAPDKKMKDAVAATEAYVRDQLGDARSFSLDSPKSRAPRIEALRKAARA
jgi:hypothetical protein